MGVPFFCTRKFIRTKHAKRALCSRLLFVFDDPFWAGLREERLLLQRCRDCRGWQWGPEWICHRCRSFEIAFEETAPQGVIYSHQRVWHPVHDALREQGPYVIVLVELPAADHVRIVGNLLGDPNQSIEIGSRVDGVFEHHADVEPAYTLLHWQRVG